MNKGHMPKGKRFPTGYTGITRADMERAAQLGYLAADACDYLGISRRTFWNYRKKWPDIQFLNSGAASWRSRIGYAV